MGAKTQLLMVTTKEERELRKAARLKKQNKTPGRGCFVFAVFLIGVIIVGYLAINDKSAENAAAAAKQVKWSHKAQDESESRVGAWLAEDQIRLDLENKAAYIAPLFWSIADSEQKKEIFVTLLIYQDTKLQSNDNSLTLYNKQSGKELASWSEWSGFDFK